MTKATYRRNSLFWLTVPDGWVRDSETKTWQWEQEAKGSHLELHAGSKENLKKKKKTLL